MQLSYVTETFYVGEMPNMKAQQTAIDLDDITDIPFGELLCYGPMEGPFQPVTMNELINLFNANQNFTNPFNDNSVFSEHAINKLKFITKSSFPAFGPYHNKITLNSLEMRNRLFEVIIEIEITLKANDEPTRRFVFSYRNSTPDTKHTIIKTLTSLLHTGMYMRGWLGPNQEFPIRVAPVPPNKDGEVALNVTHSISEYERQGRTLGKIGMEINNLPLIHYRDGHYQVSTSSNDGLTIGERLEIVKQGETSNNIASCIRLSSNWICASAHKYLTALGQSSPFDIFKLRHIS